MNICSEVTALPLKRLLFSKKNICCSIQEPLNEMAMLCEYGGGKAYFFVPQKTVSVLTISMFDEYLYNRVHKRIYLENQSQ